MQTITHTTTNAICKMLSEFWRPHLEQCEDLFKHLEYVDKSSKEIRAEALRLELQTFDDTLARQVPNDWKFKEYRRRTIITLAGRITYIRRIYIEPCGITHAYLDEILGIRTRKKLAPDAFLWIVKCASDVSFRKCAQAFYERTGARISHWLVMEVIREEGALILEEIYEELNRKDKALPNAPLRISTDTLFAEYDGIHIPLQKCVHAPKTPRWIYEQNRHKTSIELKVAVAYAGKDSKGHRGGLVHFVSNERPAYFWPLLKARVAQSYVLKDISTLYASHDAAGWCKNHRLDILAPTAQVLCHLDAFHVNRAVHRVFGVGKVASYVIGLIYSKRTKKLFSTLDRAVAHAQKGSCRKRYLELYNYLRSNVSLIGQGRYPSMGTMEGTNAHVYAARMKVWGGAWSRAGALAMALVRAHIASGHPLIAPKTDNVLLSDVQKQRRRDFEESLLDGHWRINFTEGSGWEPPQGSINLKAQMTPRLYGLLKNP